MIIGTKKKLNIEPLNAKATMPNTTLKTPMRTASQLLVFGMSVDEMSLLLEL